jgi:hypothetical protein
MLGKIAYIENQTNTLKHADKGGIGSGEVLPIKRQCIERKGYFIY